jgi:hypothetical protein
LGSAIQASNADHSQQDSETQESSPEPAGDSGVVLLIPDDIAAELRPQELRAAIAAQLGRYPGHTEQFPSRLAARRELIQRVAREEGLRQIILAQESFMPPTRSLLNFFAELRAHLAGDVLLRVCLIGKPESDAPGAARQSVPTAELRVWSEKLQTLGDPYLDALNAEAVNAE